VSAPAVKSLGAVPSADRPSFRRRAWEVYGEAVEAARDIYRVLETETKSPAALFWPENIIRKILLLLREGNSEIVALTNRSVPDHYLYGHVPNIAILSLCLGLAVGLEEEDAVTLGLAAFLSELGLASHLELASKPTTLTDEEYRLLRTHVEEGVKMLDLFPLPESERKATLRQAISQCHERISGKGYPGGLKKEAIHPFAKIIGMMDAFEAMTHTRPWRPRTLPHLVLRKMVEENQDEFDALQIRSFVECLSFYPPGTFVRLNSGEVGRVVSTSPDLPLRPRVWIFMDAAGDRLIPSREISLSASPTLFVVDAVDETALKPNDPRLSLELRAQCLWVKGL
jgi:HD-GYP domain-containing protein (c-di-GMP phosphodiesterase class II)